MKKECVGMLLAGGEGTRLGLLTKNMAKPGVYFGGKYRIIDFTLSNCANSGIDTVGVLTQYAPFALNRHLGIGQPWDMDRSDGGTSILPPHRVKNGGNWYSGTADAIYQNLHYLDQYNPEFVLVISGDHVYKMNYSAMLDFHKETGADASISVIEVPWEETSRFGIMNTNEHYTITDFEEKPMHAKNNLASMGIYIFNWPVLRQYLTDDAASADSSHDFGKDIIPKMLGDHRKLSAFPFRGYWKDVGTVQSYWEANMDLLEDESQLRLDDPDWRIYTVNPNQPPHYIGKEATVRGSMINEGCQVFGSVQRSILFYGVETKSDSFVKDSVIMPNVQVGKQVTVERAVVKENTVIPDGCVIKPADEEQVVVIDKDTIFEQFSYANQL
ncbi:glucose-1-phosphate adenylyltransferase [Alteribacillus persepolensis]|uniref:Glucose-1-phosphate adenylyltransferase n=1 Tax=Alteribacillus persepolensis TaxID=568899 RepID=A0A1G8DBT6_9BACI|nr:glucose-1-phosphate adenylyltransferase [Alteribacillus persepolensis]SDH54819.1 glucose-1-phosphate adenylyltransferase [Alteribacillus persepolensis]